MLDVPSMEHPCTPVRLLEVGPTPAPPMRDSGCVMRPAAAIFGSVYSCRNAFSLLGMVLNRPYCELGLVKPQLPVPLAAWMVHATCTTSLISLSIQIPPICRIIKVLGQRQSQRTACQHVTLSCVDVTSLKDQSIQSTHGMALLFCRGAISTQSARR